MLFFVLHAGPSAVCNVFSGVNGDFVAHLCALFVFQFADGLLPALNHPYSCSFAVLDLAVFLVSFA